MSVVEPVDLNRCQTDIIEKPGARDGAFRFGPVPPKMYRCPSRPEYVAVEQRPGADGQRGAMSLCAEHAKKLQDRPEGKHLDFITVEGWVFVEPVLRQHGLYDGPETLTKTT